MKSDCFKKCLLVLICLAIVFLTLGCGPKNNLVGYWESGNGESVEFFKDGTVLIKDRYISASGTYNIVEKNRVRIELDGIFSLGGAHVLNYEVTGNQLIFEGINYIRK